MTDSELDVLISVWRRWCLSGMRSVGLGYPGASPVARCDCGDRSTATGEVGNPEAEAVERVVVAMPELRREVVVWRFICGKPIGAIAKALKVPKKRIKDELSLAKIKLHDLL